MICQQCGTQIERVSAHVQGIFEQYPWLHQHFDGAMCDACADSWMQSVQETVKKATARFQARREIHIASCEGLEGTYGTNHTINPPESIVYRHEYRATRVFDVTAGMCGITCRCHLAHDVVVAQLQPGERVWLVN